MPQCTAKSKRSGERCRRWATNGAAVCCMHGARSPQAKAAAKRRYAQAQAAEALVRLGESIDVDPHAGLLDVVARTAAGVVVFGELVRQLEPGFDPGQALFSDGEKPVFVSTNEGLAGRTHLGDAAPHVFVVEYGNWLEKHAKACKLAIDAGIAERQIRIATEQATQIVNVIRGVLRELNVLDDPRAPSVMRKYLELAAGTAIPIEG